MKVENAYVYREHRQCSGQFSFCRQHRAVHRSPPDSRDRPSPCGRCPPLRGLHCSRIHTSHERAKVVNDQVEKRQTKQMIDEDFLKHKGKNHPIHHRVGTEHCVRCSPAHHHHHHRELRGHSQPGPAEVWPIASSRMMLLKTINCSKEIKDKKHVLTSSSHQGQTGINFARAHTSTPTPPTPTRSLAGRLA